MPLAGEPPEGREEPVPSLLNHPHPQLGVARPRGGVEKYLLVELDA